MIGSSALCEYHHLRTSTSLGAFERASYFFMPATLPPGDHGPCLQGSRLNRGVPHWILAGWQEEGHHLHHCGHGPWQGLWQDSHLPDHITASALLVREPRITWVHIHNTEIKWSEEDIIIQLEKFGNVTTSCHELVINDPDSPWQSNVCLDQWSQSENCWQPRSQSLTGPNTAAGGRPTSGEAH